MSEHTTADLRLMLAGATKFCRLDGCKGIHYYFPDETGVRGACPQIAAPVKNEPECGIEEHVTFSITFLGPSDDHSDCQLCQGRGWVANQNGWDWWRALNAIGRRRF